MEPILNLTTDDSRCEICGGQFNDNIPEAEMYDPDTDGPSYLVHYNCGLHRGWAVA